METRQTRDYPSLSFPVVCIGMSSGSLTPLRSLFQQLSPGTGMAFVVIHHLRNVPACLPQILSQCTKMPVQLASGGLLLQPNHVYVLPSGTEIGLADGHFSIRPTSKFVGFSNVFTICLESLAKSRHQGIAVILSGLDSDGAAALAAFKRHGGITIVQDPSTAEIPAMPNAAIETGCVDYALAPAAIASHLEKLADEYKYERPGHLSTSRRFCETYANHRHALRRARGTARG